MNGKQQTIGALGVSLILVNFWTGDARAAISGGLFGNGKDTARAHHELTVFAGELVFVAAATLLAGISDGLATAMVAVMVALFVLWAVHHYAGPGAVNSAHPTGATA